MADVAVTLPRVSAAASSAFTLAQLRGLVSTSLADAPLQTLLDAAMSEVARAAGPATAVELHRPHGDLLLLARPAAAVTSVVEDTTGSAIELAADDYELLGQTLVRLRTGTNPSRCWRGRVRVAYARPDDQAERIRVAVALVRLDLDYRPGIASETVGTWSATYAHAGLASYAEQRAALLASLDQGAVIR